MAIQNGDREPQGSRPSDFKQVGHDPNGNPKQGSQATGGNDPAISNRWVTTPSGSGSAALTWWGSVEWERGAGRGGAGAAPTTGRWLSEARRSTARTGEPSAGGGGGAAAAARNPESNLRTQADTLPTFSQRMRCTDGRPVSGSRRCSCSCRWNTWNTRQLGKTQ